MDAMQIVLVILALCGAWAVIELALVLRRARGMVDSLDKTVERVNDTIEEARPIVAKLDGVVDELQPAVAQLEPLLKQTTVAVEALSADLVEVNGVLRDVSTVSGAASSASNAVTGFADAASEKVQRLLSRSPRAVAPADAPSLDCAPACGSAEPPSPSPNPGRDVRPDAAEGEACADDGAATEPRRYFTYSTAEESDHE